MSRGEKRVVNKADRNLNQLQVGNQPGGAIVYTFGVVDQLDPILKNFLRHWLRQNEYNAECAILRSTISTFWREILGFPILLHEPWKRQIPQAEIEPL